MSFLLNITLEVLRQIFRCINISTKVLLAPTRGNNFVFQMDERSTTSSTPRSSVTPDSGRGSNAHNIKVCKITYRRSCNIILLGDVFK